MRRLPQPGSGTPPTHAFPGAPSAGGARHSLPQDIAAGVRHGCPNTHRVAFTIEGVQTMQILEHIGMDIQAPRVAPARRSPPGSPHAVEIAYLEFLAYDHSNLNTLPVSTGARRADMLFAKITRRTLVGAATVAALAATFPAAWAQSTTAIRIASVNSPTTESLVVVQKVADRITARTQNRVTFKLFPSGQLGTTNDSLEQASQGQPVITYTSASFMANFGVPELSVVEGPFIVANNEQGERLAFSPLMQGWYDQLAAKSGIRIVALNWFDGPRHMIGSAGYSKPESLKGVRMRVPPVESWIKTFQPLGVVATTVEAAETYSALSQGVVAAAESPLTGLRASKWFEVAKHITLTGHFNLFTGWVMSEAIFKGLSPGDRSVLLEEFRKGGQELSKLSLERAASIRKEFEAAGVTFHDADVEAYRKATASYYTSFPKWPAGLHEKVLAAAKGQ